MIEISAERLVREQVEELENLIEETGDADKALDQFTRR